MNERLTTDFELTVAGITFRWRSVFPQDHERPYRIRVEGFDFHQPGTMSPDFVDGFITGVKMAQAINERKGELSTNR